MTGLAYDAVMSKAAVGIDVLAHPVYTVRCGGCGERLGAEYWVSVGEWHALCEACTGEVVRGLRDRARDRAARACP